MSAQLKKSNYANRKNGWFAYARVCSDMLAYFMTGSGNGGLLARWEREAGIGLCQQLLARSGVEGYECE